MTYQELDGLVEQNAKFILNHSPQIFRKINNSYVCAHASSILIGFNDSIYLITANHVFTDGKSDISTQIGFLNDYDFRIPIGERKIIDNDNNDYDIGVVKLKNEVVSDEIDKYYSFLDLNNIELGHKFSKDNLYLVVGFPVTRSKFDYKNKSSKILIDPFIFVTSFKESDNYKVKFVYDKKKIKDFSKSEIQEGPDLNGLSGCGVWYLDSKNQNKPKLVAITHTWDKNKKEIIATKSDVVNYMLNNQ